MERMNLLEITQSILTSMVSDDVNSIDDTDESLVVVGIIQDTYYEIGARENWNWLKKVGNLGAYGNPDYPNFLVSPVPIVNLQHVRYNIRTSTDTIDKYRTTQYEEPEDFLNRVLNRFSTATNVDTVVYNGVNLGIFNDRGPAYFTSFDDDVLVFDAYDSSVDTTLQASKSVAEFIRIPDWTPSDSFVPDLPPNLFPFLLSESKVACHQYLKNSGNPIDAKRSFRQGSMAKWNERKVRDRAPRKGFGRK